MAASSKIVRAEVIRIGGETKPIANPDGIEEALIVRLTDADGRQGIGECDAAAPVMRAFLDMPAGTTKSRNVLDIVLGAEPLEAAALWDRLYRGTIYTGRRGAGIHAISAVDVALHDLAARQLGVPVWKLLGGARTERLVPYATIWQGYPRGRPLEEQLAIVEHQTQTAIAHGFRALKFEVPFGEQASDRKLAELIRWYRELVGPDIRVIVDFCYRWHVWSDARRLLDRIVDCDIAFAEAALQHDDLDGHARLAATSPVPVAGAEFAATRWEIREWIERGGVHVVQPSLARSGGLTELKRICDMAELAGVQVVPHGWAAGIVDVASLHLQAAALAIPMVEWKSPDVYASPIRRELTKPDFRPVDGVIAPPAGPGLGIALDEAFVERYATDRLVRTA